MSVTRSLSPFLAVILAAALAAGCNGAGPTTTPPTAPTKKPVTPPKDDGTPDKPKPLNPDASYFGKVLAIGGKPAANVEVRAYIIANHGGALVTDNGAGLVTDNGAGIIANHGGSYRLAQAGPTSVRTDANGEFTIGLQPGQKYNLEAVESDTVKGIRGGIEATSRGIDLQLATVGSIRGKVTTPAERKITDYTGVDVFIPGTSYVAKADKEGNFVLSNVPVGTFKLYATKPGVGSATSAAVKVVSEQEANVGEVLLALEPLSVKRVAPGTAIEGQTVTISGERFGASTGATYQVLVGSSVIAASDRDTDNQIRFKVPAGVSSGPVTVVVSGLPSDSQPLKIATEFAIAAPRAGVPVPGGAIPLTVSARDASGPIAPPPLDYAVTAGKDVATVDATGKLTPIKPGTVTVRASAGDFAADLKLKVLDKAPAVAGALGGTSSELLGTLGGLAFGPGGSLLLANVGNVLKLDAGATAPTPFAGDPANYEGSFDGDPEDGTGTAATFGTIAGLARSPDGTHYVLDYDTIRAISATGDVSTVAGDPGSTVSQRDGAGSAAILTSPMFPAFAGGLLYFTDEAALRTLDPVSEEVKTLVRDVKGEIAGLTADADGNVYVLVDGVVKRWDGAKLTTVPASYRLAQADEGEEEDEADGLDEDADETDAAAEADEADEEDEELEPGDLDFFMQRQLARASDGTFYSSMEGKIQKRVGTGWLVIAGGGGDGPKDGSGTAAGFSMALEGLSFGPDGALYALDEGAVRRIDVKAAGVPVTTVWRAGSDQITARSKKAAAK